MRELTRRRFVSHAAEGVAAAGAVAAFTQSASSASVSETIRIGMIGMGGRARGFVNDFKRHRDVAVTAVCDVDESNAGRGAEVFEKALGRKPKMFSDFRRVLDDESIDVVISNGVINLCPDKMAVMQQVYRVLKPGGRFQIADIVVHQEVPQDAKDDIDLWSG